MALSYTGGLQGTGDTRSPLYISILSQIVVPLGLCTIFQATCGLEAGYIWMAILAGHMTRCALSVARFRQQKWRDIKVDLEPPKPHLVTAEAELPGVPSRISRCARRQARLRGLATQLQRPAPNAQLQRSGRWP